MAKVEYKPPGVDEWQVLELVVDRVHHRVWVLDGPSESERKFQAHREAVRKAGEPQGMGELLAALFGEPVPRRTPEDPGKPVPETMLGGRNPEDVIQEMLGGRSTEDVLQEMLGIPRRRR